MKSRVALNDDVPNSVLLTAIDFKRNRWQGCSLLVQEDTASIRSLSSSMSSLARKLKTLTKKLHLWRMWFLPVERKWIFGSHAWIWMNSNGEESQVSLNLTMRSNVILKSLEMFHRNVPSLANSVDIAWSQICYQIDSRRHLTQRKRTTSSDCDGITPGFRRDCYEHERGTQPNCGL